MNFIFLPVVQGKGSDQQFLLSPGLILTGVVAYCLPSMAGIQGFIFFIAGFICLVPGAYHLVYIYLAVKGKRGFDFHHLPLFN